MTRDGREALLAAHQPAAIRKRLGQPPRPQYLSDAVLGGIDGCVTTFAVVSGAVGAGLSPGVAMVMGVANLVADGFSMAVSNYEAMRAQQEHISGLRRAEQEHIQVIPEGEREEVRQIFAAKGFSGATLESVVETICSDQGLWVETMLKEEHDVPRLSPDPWRSALTTFVAFCVVGLVPLLPFFTPVLSMGEQFAVSGLLAALMFLSIGMAKSLVLGKPVLRSGLSTLLNGSAAAGLAYAVGWFLQAQFGIA